MEKKKRAIVFFVLALLSVSTVIVASHIRKEAIKKWDLPVDCLIAISLGKIEPEPQLLRKYVNYYKVLLRAEPQNSDLLRLLAYCYYRLGEAPQAALFYQRAINSDPDYFWDHYNLGLLYYLQSEYRLAIVSFEKVITMSGVGTADRVLNSKYLKYHDGKGLESCPAAEPLETDVYLKNYASHVGNNLYRGYRKSFELIVLSSLRRKDFKRMILVTQKAQKLKLGNEKFFTLYEGIALYSTGQINGAIDALGKCLKLDPQNWEAHYYLSLAFEKQGLDNLAKEMMSRAQDFSLKQEDEDFGKKYHLILY